MKAQHTTPCNECPFRRKSLPGWLGSNDPKSFAILANRDGHFPCHKTMGKGRAKELQCAGRAILYANQCKVARDNSVPRLPPDRENVLGNIFEFAKHHEIELTMEEIVLGKIE